MGQAVEKILQKVLTTKELAVFHSKRTEKQFEIWVIEYNVIYGRASNRPITMVQFIPTEKVITNAGLVYLKQFKSLYSLDFSSTKITDAGLVHVGQLKSIQSLHLRDTLITNSGLMHLKDLKLLKTLDITNTKITDAGIKHLRDFKSLEALHLDDTKVTDAGLVHLKKIKTLKYLSLNKTKITNDGLVNLESLKSLKSLHLRNLRSNKLTKKQVARLKKSLPKCKIVLQAITTQLGHRSDIK